MKTYQKNSVKLLTIVALSFSTFALTSINSSAATKKVSYKSTSLKYFREVKPGLNTIVYSKPSLKSEKMTKIPANSGVVITGQTSKGFSKIRYQFGYAYVKTANLMKASSNTSTKYARNIHQKYHYDLPLNAGSGFARTFYAKYTTTYKYIPAVKNFWHLTSSPDQTSEAEYDTKKGLYVGDMEDGYLSLAIKYPVSTKKSWVGPYGTKTKVISKKNTVKTTAGTFKNVVSVKNGKIVSYFAPNKGLIQVKENNKTVLKLIK